MIKTDYLIIRAGIIGLALARELQRIDAGAKITIIDKELTPGCHSSSRNSGVLHSGIYYPSDSLKARFTREENIVWINYCIERNLPLDHCGKLIVSRNEEETDRLRILEDRAAANGVDVFRLDEKAVRDIEPRARTSGYALFVPSTATVDPLSIVNSLVAEFQANFGNLLCGSPYLGCQPNNTIFAGNERIQAGTIINCAGLYADRVARDFGFGQRYTLLPFKGIYRYADNDVEPPRTHIYPVPDLRHPFLGVHITRTVDGQTKIGPTAIPAFWREHYSGLDGFNAGEFIEVAGRELSMLITNSNDFRSMALHELRKNRRANMLADAAALMDGAEKMGFYRLGKPGIRAQLVERKSNQRVMDFVVEGNAKNIHILNAVSPGLTCAIPFTKYIVNSFLERNSSNSIGF